MAISKTYCNFNIISGDLKIQTEFGHSLEKFRGENTFYLHKLLQETVCTEDQQKLKQHMDGKIVLESCHTLKKYEESKYKAWNGFQVRASHGGMVPLSSIKDEYVTQLQVLHQQYFLSHGRIQKAFEALNSANFKPELQVQPYSEHIPILAELLEINDRNIENDWKETTQRIMSDSNFICEQKSDRPEMFWSRALKTFSMTPAIKMLVKKAMVVAHSSADAERTFSIINAIRNNNRQNLLPRNVNHLIRVKMNGPSLNSFNPEKYVMAWKSEGHRSSDSFVPPSKKRKPTFEGDHSYAKEEESYESIIY